MILNPNKTKALVSLVVSSTSRAVNPPYCDIVSWVSICATPNLDILGEKFCRSSPSKTMCVVLSKKINCIEQLFEEKAG